MAVLPDNSNIVKLFDFDMQKSILNNLVEYTTENDDILFDIVFDKSNKILCLGR